MRISDIKNFLKTISLKKALLSVHVVTFVLAIIVVILDQYFFNGLTYFEYYNTTIPLNDYVKSVEGIHTFEINFPQKCSHLFVYTTYYSQSVDTTTELVISVTSYLDEELQYTRTSNTQVFVGGNNSPEPAALPRALDFNKVEITVHYTTGFQPEDYIVVTVRVDSLDFLMRLTAIRSIYFFCSLIFFIYFLKAKTSQYRTIAGFILSIYSVIAMCPFTEYFHSFPVEVVHIIAKSCISGLILMYGVTLRDSPLLEFLAAGVTSLINFGSLTAIGCKMYMHDYDRPFEPMDLDIPIYRTAFFLTLIVLAAYGAFNKIARDNDPRNIYLYVIAVAQSILVYLSTIQYEYSWYYALSIGLMHSFIYSFPTQVRQRVRMTKQMRRQPDKIKVSELQPVKQEKKLSKRTTTEEYSSDESSDYSYEDSSEYSSDDSYESYETSDDYQDSSDQYDYESSSTPPKKLKGKAKAPPPKKKYTRKYDSSDYD